MGGGCGLPPLQGLFIIVAEWVVNILNSIQESCWCHGNLIAAPDRPKLLLPPASLYELAGRPRPWCLMTCMFSEICFKCCLLTFSPLQYAALWFGSVWENESTAGPLTLNIPSSQNGQEVSEWFWAWKEKEDERGLLLPYTKEEIMKVHL